MRALLIVCVAGSYALFGLVAAWMADPVMALLGLEDDGAGWWIAFGVNLGVLAVLTNAVLLVACLRAPRGPRDWWDT